MNSRTIRSWHVIPLTTLLVCAVGIPIVWFSTPLKYETTGRIRIAPVVSRILFDSDDSRGLMSNYNDFKNAEASRIFSSTVLDRAADELKCKALAMLNGAPDQAAALRKLVNDGTIRIQPDRRTEFITLSMISSSPDEAEQVIDAVIRSYINIVRAEDDTADNSTLNVLNEQKRKLEARIALQNQEITRLLEPSGKGEHEITPETAAKLQQAIADAAVQQVALHARLTTLENHQAAPAQDSTQELQAYINADPVVQALAKEIAHHEVLAAQAQNQPDQSDPAQNAADTFEVLNKRLADLKSQLTEQFESDRRARMLAGAKAELAQALQHEKELRRKLEPYLAMARRHLNLDDKKAEVERTRKLYNQICDRISEIEIEQKRPVRISIAETAASIPLKSHRNHLTAATILAGLLLGIVLTAVHLARPSR